MPNPEMIEERTATNESNPASSASEELSNTPLARCLGAAARDIAVDQAQRCSITKVKPSRCGNIGDLLKSSRPLRPSERGNDLLRRRRLWETSLGEELPQFQWRTRTTSKVPKKEIKIMSASIKETVEVTL